MFEDVTAAPPDAILGLTDAFRRDSNPNKVNLGVGVYKDDTGHTPILSAVKKAEQRLCDTQDTKSYMPINGAPAYGKAVQALLFGSDHEVVQSGRACTAHTPGGTGALRVGGDFLKKLNPDASLWVSSPTWANHKGVFTAAGFTIKDYPYYDKASKTLDFDAMLESLKAVPAGDVVLLHVCCHNPTGVDPSEEQWAAIAEAAAVGGWTPFLDFAYQGFGVSIEADRTPIRLMLEQVSEVLIASSFSKNVGLYQDRTGALTIVAADTEQAAAAFSHVKATIRVNYSNPPAHGGWIVSTIMEDEALRAEWEAELASMRVRIHEVRQQLVAGLAAQGVDIDFSFITTQNGMFSFSGLSDDQVAFLRDEKGIYIVKGGRINVAGITSANIDYLCVSLAEALGR